jgi:catechol 2,3-dioxygenase-like lactoylglutathione lyase family enzyme
MAQTTIDTCGCPPTAAAGEGGVHHVFLNVTDLARARRFYAWLMPRLGYPGVTDMEGVSGYWGKGGSVWIKQTPARFAADSFDKDRVGLCEIAFRADSRAQVDALARALAAEGVRILDPPREYTYTPGYYALFFADPDGIKLEVVHIPGNPTLQM